jgi:hypothetical protein
MVAWISLSIDMKGHRFLLFFFPGFCLQVYEFVFVLEASRRPQTYVVKQWVFFFCYCLVKLVE